jgi:hypothetical protein
MIAHSVIYQFKQHLLYFVLVKAIYWVRLHLVSFLDGIVNKVSSDHIGVLVLGVFNASIPADQIRKKEFKWDPASHQWSTNTEYSIRQGTPVRFSVKDILVNHEIISIVGSLTQNSENTGIIDVAVPLHLLEELAVPNFGVALPAIEIRHDESPKEDEIKEETNHEPNSLSKEQNVEDIKVKDKKSKKRKSIN